MPVTLDATVNGANANSFATVAEGDLYFANRLYSTAWTSLTGGAAADTKAQALIMATARLDVLPWAGVPSTLTQRLQWGRMGTVDRGDRVIDYDVIPDDIKAATFEEALSLLVKGRDPGTTDPLANFSAIKVGSLAISLRENAPRTNDGLHPGAVRLVLPYLINDADFSRG
jgi:hypothetical protein